MRRAVSARSFSASDLPTLDALREQEGVGHGAADHQRLDLADEVSSRSSLVETLAPPTMAITGRCGCPAPSPAPRVRPAWRGRHRPAAVGEPFGRGVRAVGGGEGVVDVDVAELGQRGDERGIVLLLARVEAGVFEQQDVAGLHRGDRGFGRGADAVLGEGDRPARRCARRGGDRLQRLLRVAALGPAEMREQDHLAALVGDLA